jgi:hypothetical protein
VGLTTTSALLHQNKEILLKANQLFSCVQEREREDNERLATEERIRGNLHDLYVVGGYNGSYLKSMEMFDQELGKW